MKSCHIALGLLMLVCAACAGLPPKPTPAQLPAAAPIDGLEVATVARNPLTANRSARHWVRSAGAAAGAHVEGNASFDRQRLSENGLFPPELLGFTWYNEADLGLQASYTFDWWGKQRDAVQAAVDFALERALLGRAPQ